MNYSALFASTAAPVADVVVALSARTWTAPRDCTVKITILGGSGSGGARRGVGGNATGGGAGAKCIKTAKLKAGDVLTLTPGVGGAAVAPAVGGAVNGNDGTASTVTGPNGLNMIAGPGKGGKANADATVALSGGDGGTASGGGENIAGGRGGNAAAASTATYSRATGGGALPLTGTGFRGGDIASSGDRLATGGAGVGGNGGDIGGSIANAATGGGSAHASAPAAPSSDGYSEGGAAIALISLTSWLQASGRGSAGSTSNSLAGGVGGGGGGCANASTGAAAGGEAGAFAGSGGAVTGSAPTASRGSSEACYGGSGGAVGGVSNPCTAAKGGDGLIVLEVY